MFSFTRCNLKRSFEVHLLAGSSWYKVHLKLSFEVAFTATSLAYLEPSLIGGFHFENTVVRAAFERSLIGA